MYSHVPDLNTALPSFDNPALHKLDRKLTKTLKKQILSTVTTIAPENKFDQEVINESSDIDEDEQYH